MSVLTHVLLMEDAEVEAILRNANRLAEEEALLMEFHQILNESPFYNGEEDLVEIFNRQKANF